MSTECVPTPVLIAAVGNIEAKALTYAFLPDDEFFSASGIKHRIESAQGQEPRATDRSVYRNYCEGDFVSVGLVAREYHERFGWVRYQRITDERALAVAGLMSASSLVMPSNVGLRHVWSSTSIPILLNRGDEVVQRGPEGRTKIFKALSDVVEPISGATFNPGISTSAISEHFIELARLGIVSYDSFDGNSIDPIISVEPDFLPKGPLQAIIAHAILENGGTLTKKCLVDLLAPNYKDRQRASSIIHSTIQRMKLISGFNIEGEVSREEFSQISLTDEWRGPIKRITEGITAIDELDSKATNHFIDGLGRIMKDPRQVSYLMHKSFDVSRLSQSRRSEKPKLSDIIKGVLCLEELDIQELATRLKGENRRSIRTELHQLIASDVVKLQPSGKYTIHKST